MIALDCEIYQPGKRAANTEKQQSAIRNCELSSLDLLVREMIQNSLDAALDEDRSKAVAVLFRRGLFDVQAFAECLGAERASRGADYSRLLRKYMNNNNIPNSYLAIQDYGCVGLDGDVSDRNSRAWKLPFGFFDGQKSDSTAGGANGVGKVVAFRFGIGFVVYYSRTKDGSSRFVIAYMDDGFHNVFPADVMPDGAAWWGKRSNDSHLGVVCLEKENDIRELLTIFGIDPYEPDRCGTMTIIPFFNEQSLLDEVPEYVKKYCPWVGEFDSYVKFCINQWYAPRLRGDRDSFDPESIGNVPPYHWGRSLKRLPPLPGTNPFPDADKVFSLIRELFDVAVGDREPNNGILRIPCPMRRNAPKLNISFGGDNLGWVAVKKINYLSGEYTGVLPVLCFLVPGHIEDDTEESFLARLGDRRGFMLYCRRHGMIVSYESDWDKICYASLPKPQDGEFYVGIFVVDSDSTITAPSIHNENHTASIDVMFRSFEKTDHYGWPRQASYEKVSIVNPLLRKIRVSLSEEFHSNSAVPKREPLDRLSAILGSFVSAGGNGFGDGPNPSPEGVGGVPGIGTGGSRTDRHYGGGARRGGEGGAGSSEMRFQQLPPVFELDNHQTFVSIPVTICFTQKEHCAKITCGIVQDGSNEVLCVEGFSTEEVPVKLKNVEVIKSKSPVSITQDDKAASVIVRASKKGDIKVICRYELIRKDAALAIDCRSIENRSKR